jgi:hypothetical protein
MTVNESTLTIYQDGTQLWVKNGIIHKEDGPAIIYPNGTMMWVVNGIVHNENGPALIRSDGSRGWFLNGQIYKISGPDDGGDDRQINKKRLIVSRLSGGDE